MRGEIKLRSVDFHSRRSQLLKKPQDALAIYQESSSNYKVFD